MRRDLSVGILASVGAVSLVSAFVAALEPHVPVLSLACRSS